jgi:DNA-binding NarL/FixJ family response regulator
VLSRSPCRDPVITGSANKTWKGKNVALLKTLVVDDHVAVRNALRGLIEEEPELECVGEAANGLLAMEAVRTLKPDLLLLDINMPERNGLEVLRMLRYDKNDILVVILSNHTDIHYVDAAMRLGANAFVRKDSGFEVLLQAIQTILAGEVFVDPGTCPTSE